MSLRSILTKERSRNRTLFVACGLGFAAYSVWHFWYGNWGVACVLGGFGSLSLCAGTLLGEQHLNVLTAAILLITVIAAVAALAMGVRVQ